MVRAVTVVPAALTVPRKRLVDTVFHSSGVVRFPRQPVGVAEVGSVGPPPARRLSVPPQSDPEGPPFGVLYELTNVLSGVDVYRCQTCLRVLLPADQFRLVPVGHLCGD